MKYYVFEFRDFAVSKRPPFCEVVVRYKDTKKRDYLEMSQDAFDALKASGYFYTGVPIDQSMRVVYGPDDLAPLLGAPSLDSDVSTVWVVQIQEK